MEKKQFEIMHTAVSLTDEDKQIFSHVNKNLGDLQAEYGDFFAINGNLVHIQVVTNHFTAGKYYSEGRKPAFFVLLTDAGSAEANRTHRVAAETWIENQVKQDIP